MSTDLTIVPIETPSLGDRSYLGHDGEVAFVVDPQRDIDRVLDLLEQHAVRLTDVFETHIHNDYVTGGLALAERTGAAYYARMSPANAAGPSEPDLSPPTEVDAGDLRRRIDAGEWVVDLRNRTAFATGHAPGTLNFGLDGAFATYLGWLITWGTPVTLLGETPEDVAEAQRELVRIGIDRPAAQATGGPEDWSDRGVASFPTGTFADLEQVRRHRPVVVLDVRRADEHDKARIKGAVNIPIHELPGRVDDVPAGELWVHCASGYRASVAASILDAEGRRLVAVDDDFENAEKVGLHLVGPEG
jgi:hydroxyacylglutathione hydrolase